LRKVQVDFEREQSRWINFVGRGIPHVPSQVRIAGIEATRIFADSPKLDATANSTIMLPLAVAGVAIDAAVRIRNYDRPTREETVLEALSIAKE
jgi:hypothetical protein